MDPLSLSNYLIFENLPSGFGKFFLAINGRWFAWDGPLDAKDGDAGVLGNPLAYIFVISKIYILDIFSFSLVSWLCL